MSATLKLVQPEPRQKSARQRYTRIFPERWRYLRAELNAREALACLDLLFAYVGRDGELPDDDRELARHAGVSAKLWSALRAKLIALGLFEVKNGRWVDPDQDRSLEIQRRMSARGLAGATKKWERHRRVESSE